MKSIFLALFAFAALQLAAQNDKLLLQVDKLADKIEAPRVSMYPLYTDLFRVGDLGDGFVLNFGRTFACFDDNMELRWKQDLPEYVNMPPATEIFGDKDFTYIVEFGPNISWFKKCQVTTVDNNTGTASAKEYTWDDLEKYLLDYNYYNGKLSFIFGKSASDGYTYKLLTIANGAQQWTNFTIPDSDKYKDAEILYSGDMINGPNLILEGNFKIVDKATKKHYVVYNTVTVSLEGKVGNVEMVEIDVTNPEHGMRSSALLAATLGEERYYFGLYEGSAGFPQGFVYGKSPVGGTFNKIKTHADKFTNKIVAPPDIKFEYLPEADLFVAQMFYMKQTRQGNIKRVFIDREGTILWQDDLEVEVNNLTGDANLFALTTYKTKTVGKGTSTGFPAKLGYFNIIEEFSRKGLEQLVYFVPLKRKDGYTVIIIDPNSGRVTGRKI